MPAPEGMVRVGMPADCTRLLISCFKGRIPCPQSTRNRGSLAEVSCVTRACTS
jgi:hypothetical protein